MSNTIEMPRIQRMTVEVSVLKIGNSKMTLAVFDQLYSGQCFDDKTGRLNCQIWGKVKRKDRTYLIFQKGSDLQKMWMPFDFRELYNFQNSVAYTIARILQRSNIEVDGHFLNAIHADIYPFKAQAIDALRKKHKMFYRVPLDEEAAWFLNMLDENEMNQITNNYNQKEEYAKSYNAMLHEVNNAKQLFIAT